MAPVTKILGWISALLLSGTIAAPIHPKSTGDRVPNDVARSKHHGQPLRDVKAPFLPDTSKSHSEAMAPSAVAAALPGSNQFHNNERSSANLVENGEKRSTKKEEDGDNDVFQSLLEALRQVKNLGSSSKQANAGKREFKNLLGGNFDGLKKILAKRDDNEKRQLDGLEDIIGLVVKRAIDAEDQAELNKSNIDTRDLSDVLSKLANIAKRQLGFVSGAKELPTAVAELTGVLAKPRDAELDARQLDVVSGLATSLTNTAGNAASDIGRQALSVSGDNVRNLSRRSEEPATEKRALPPIAAPNGIGAVMALAKNPKIALVPLTDGVTVTDKSLSDIAKDLGSRSLRVSRP